MAPGHPSGELTPARFIAKWGRTELSERAASHEHFINLCHLLGQPTPGEHDAIGAEYTFEKGMALGGPGRPAAQAARGFADVWWRGKFAWEYKRKDKYPDLAAAYQQLCKYREALENPPLLIVSDIARTEIHTNFTGTAKRVHAVSLEEMDLPDKLALLRRVFTDPASFRPDVTPEGVTQDVAEQFALLARSLEDRGHDPHQAAHFLMKCMFCLFAEDVGLLPGSLLTRLLTEWKDEPRRLPALLTELFDRMRTGGAFGTERIAFFNGGLFDESPALELTGPEIGELLLAARHDWSAVEPSIFGTLFERSLDPSKRAQIGAHYTSRDDILLVVEPVILAPLRRQWAEVRQKVEQQLQRRRTARTAATRRRADQAVAAELGGFLNRLGELRVLDPACGSGNFLYVAIQQLLNLEKEVITFAARGDIGLGFFPTIRPTQLHGIEINPYAAELAQVVVWIGYLQWMRDNGFNAPRDPILQPLQTIECRDAILDLCDPDNPRPADWPDAHFIVGNPPFLGCRRFRDGGLSDEYILAMHAAHDLPQTCDLCCYWFEHARRVIEKHPAVRVGLLATQGIRGVDNREVLARIQQQGDIFAAWPDRPWVLDGADVRVSIIAFSGATSEGHQLDGKSVGRINPDLSSELDLSSCPDLSENRHIAFMGDTKGGAFDIPWTEARRLLAQPNPADKSNIDVVRPWVNGGDITKRPRGMFIVDFGPDRSMGSACEYEAPFSIVEERVKPERAKNRRESYAAKWWLHVEPRPAFRRAVASLERFLVTPRVAKHRLFMWCTKETLPDSRIFAFARSDGYFFGALHSAVHELWTLRTCAWHGVGNDPTYNATTCFETFALPWPPGGEPKDDALVRRISDAAAALNEQRERWLNPPEWIDPIARQVDAREDFCDVPEPARELIRQSAIMAEAAADKELKRRTLTNLYNQRPTWLKLAHRELDRAVLAAYAAVDAEGGWAEDWAEVWSDSGAGQPLPADHPLAQRRAEIDQAVLGNLLRLNLARGAQEPSR